MKELIIEKIPSLDWKLGIQLVGGNKKLAIFVLNQLVESLSKEAYLINDAFKQNDLHKLQGLIHKLYGACCYTGLLKLKQILKQISHKLTDNITNKNHNTHAEQIKEFIHLFNHEISYILNNYLKFFQQ